MAQNALMKVPDGAGGFTELHPETDAEAVKYGASDVKTMLDTLTAANFISLDSPAFTGTPTAPTAGNDTDSTQLATTEFVQNLIRRLVGSAPSTLDTLAELATAINNDPQIATTITQALDNKLSKTDASSTYLGKTATATAATKATQDGSGNTITSTYLTSSSVSTFMKSILSASNAEAARKLLGVSYDLSDVTGKAWTGLAPQIVTDKYKFGSASLFLRGTGIMKPNVTLGGSNFTVAGWFYAPETIPTNLGLVDWGDTNNWFHVFIDSSGRISIITMKDGTAVIRQSSRTTSFGTGAWRHVEMDYRNSDATFFLFYNGSLVYSGVDTSFQTARTFPLYLGREVSKDDYYNIYVDEFYVTKSLLHTAAFSVPTSTYGSDSDTVALLHFE